MYLVGVLYAPGSRRVLITVKLTSLLYSWIITERATGSINAIIIIGQSLFEAVVLRSRRVTTTRGFWSRLLIRGVHSHNGYGRGRSSGWRRRLRSGGRRSGARVIACWGCCSCFLEFQVHSYRWTMGNGIIGSIGRTVVRNAYNREWKRGKGWGEK